MSENKLLDLSFEFAVAIVNFADGEYPVRVTKNPVHESGRDFYLLLLTSSLLPQPKLLAGFLESNK